MFANSHPLDCRLRMVLGGFWLGCFSTASAAADFLFYA
jgi:hypothetical protein